LRRLWFRCHEEQVADRAVRSLRPPLGSIKPGMEFTIGRFSPIGATHMLLPPTAQGAASIGTSPASMRPPMSPRLGAGDSVAARRGSGQGMLPATPPSGLHRAASMRSKAQAQAQGAGMDRIGEHYANGLRRTASQHPGGVDATQGTVHGPESQDRWWETAGHMLRARRVPAEVAFRRRRIAVVLGRNFLVLAQPLPLQTPGSQGAGTGPKMTSGTGQSGVSVPPSPQAAAAMAASRRRGRAILVAPLSAVDAEVDPHASAVLHVRVTSLQPLPLTFDLGPAASSSAAEAAVIDALQSELRAEDVVRARLRAAGGASHEGQGMVEDAVPGHGTWPPPVPPPAEDAVRAVARYAVRRHGGVRHCSLVLVLDSPVTARRLA